MQHTNKGSFRAILNKFRNFFFIWNEFKMKKQKPFQIDGSRRTPTPANAISLERKLSRHTSSLPFCLCSFCGGMVVAVFVVCLKKLIVELIKRFRPWVPDTETNSSEEMLILPFREIPRTKWHHSPKAKREREKLQNAERERQQGSYQTEPFIARRVGQNNLNMTSAESGTSTSIWIKL